MATPTRSRSTDRPVGTIIEPSACTSGRLAGMTVHGVKEPDLDAERSPRRRVPLAMPGRDLRELPLSTLEAYVYSRIDGSMAEDDIVVCTGLDAAVVTQALDRLASFGVVSFQWAMPRRAISQTQTRAAPNAATTSADASQATRLPSASPSASPRAGAPPARTNPPRATAATRRPAGATIATPSPENRGRSGIPMRGTTPPARATTLSDFVAKPPARVTSRSVQSLSPETAPPPPLGTLPPPRVSSIPPGEPRSLTPIPPTHRPDSMRPEYGDSMRRYLEGARQAIAEGNAAAAANFYRLAQQIAPTDPAIGVALAECSSVSAETRASTDRAMTLVLLGDNAARSKQWGVATEAYEEAASLLGKDANVLYKLAGALYRSGGHLARANKLVEESLALSRNRVEPWLLLAQIRWESGARAGAREALEEARRLRPDDERVTKLLVKFGSIR